jgi:hypothetical protein
MDAGNAAVSVKDYIGGIITGSISNNNDDEY